MMSRYNADYALPEHERPPGLTREIAAEPGRAGEDAASPADQPSPERPIPDRAIGFQLEADAIGAATKRLRGLFDLVPVMDQISEATTDMALALEERRWADFNVTTGKLASLVNHLCRAIEQRQPRKRRT